MVTIKTTPSGKMAELLDKAGVLGVLKTSDLVEGEVTTVSGNRVWVDIDAGRFVGVISSRELAEAGISMPDYKIGDKVTASVVEPENDEGVVILSVREALKNKGWSTLEEKFTSKEIVKAKVIEANRGGLIMEAGGIRGFMPVSQLTPAHYPRVGNDKDEILSKLTKFENQMLDVVIIGFDKIINKLIFSERAAKQDEFDEMTAKIQIGEILTGKVSGVVDFGIFVSFGALEGLIHISEISWDKVQDPREFAKVGDKVQVQVIGIEGDKISLSMKRLLEDQWLSLIKDYKVGQVVKGEIMQIMPFGVFVKVDDKIDGLIHISELSFDHVTDPTEVVKVGDKPELKVIDIEPESHRFGLSLKAMQMPADAVITATTKKKSSSASNLSTMGLSDALVRKLKEAGIQNVSDLKNKSADEIKAIKGIGEKSAAKIIEALK
ncbi:S1 RNA-binding domain-containing protein [Patescibacteria group bacterium]|nr:S1 RNA-binding domain-containing protein [Patescibacteria group bacterium]